MLKLSVPCQTRWNILSASVKLHCKIVNLLSLQQITIFFITLLLYMAATLKSRHMGVQSFSRGVRIVTPYRGAKLATVQPMVM